MRSTTASIIRPRGIARTGQNAQSARKAIIMAQVLTVKEVAQKWEITPRTLRKFLRKDTVAQGGKVGEDTPGKGGRYSLDAKSLRSLKVRFDAWVAANAAKAEEVTEATESDDADIEVEALEGDNTDTE